MQLASESLYEYCNVKEFRLCLTQSGSAIQSKSTKPLRRLGMKTELTAIIKAAEEEGYWAICPEVPGANGQGETIEEAKESLKRAIQLILDDRLANR